MEISSPSPFDAIRHTDANGLEFWSARDLMHPLGYSQWRDFSSAIERGRAALEMDGQDPDVHIAGLRASANGRGAAQTRADYRMTREGAYAVVQGGDPRKPQIAGAWSYFRVKTREAEIREATGHFNIPRTLPEALRYAAAQAEQIAIQAAEIEAKAQELTSARPKVLLVDTFIEGDGDPTTIRVLANQLKIGERELREFLVGRKIIYRKQDRRYSRSQGRITPEHSWHAYAQYKEWFTERDQPDAPRAWNGQLRTTLYVTPIGKSRIAELLRKRNAA